MCKHLYDKQAGDSDISDLDSVRSEMEKDRGVVMRLVGIVSSFIRKWMFRVLSVGPIPDHIAFILDGNRRYAKKWNLEEGAGHKAGFFALMSTLKYCYELGLKYVSVYAFSIENFRRRPEEVQYLMNLMQEKIEGLLNEESIVNEYGVRVYFVGNLKLLSDPVRIAAEKVMMATANNTKTTLLICVAYTSTDEIVHAVQESCKEKLDGIQDHNGVNEGIEKSEEDCVIKLVDIEKHMYNAVAPNPDILIRTSGEKRLSNFLLWQTTCCLLYCPAALWPEISLCHLVWALLNFQHEYPYLEKRKKQS